MGDRVMGRVPFSIRKRFPTLLVFQVVPTASADVVVTVNTEHGVHGMV